MKESNNKTTSSRTSAPKAEKTVKTTTARAKSTTVSRSNNPEGYNQYTKHNQKK